MRRVRAAGSVRFRRAESSLGDSARRFRFPAGRRAHPHREDTAISIQKAPEIRVNERIRVPQVRVIGDDGEQIGVLATREALALAQSKGMDLVEVSPTARPPVCRIMDYGKFKYEQNRKARKARRNQHQMQLKEIKLRPKIDDHDYGFKMQHARAFLEGRDKVKVTVTFRGREMAHPELGHALIRKVMEALADVSTVEQPPRTEGRTLNMVLMPKPPKPGGAPKENSPAPGEAPGAVAAAPRPEAGPKESA